jgi:hypothetical protein
MKTVSCLILCLFAILSSGSLALHPAVAADPLISLTAKNEPLGDVLAGITRDTGYRFNLNRKWQDHPVSATIGNLTLEQGLKRLLRSLNHTIIWESDKTVTIMVFGKADPSPSGPAISFKAPPRSEPEAIETSIEPDAPPADEPEPADAAVADEENREPETGVSTQQADSPEEPSGESEGEPAEPDPSDADTPPEGLKVDD